MGFVRGTRRGGGLPRSNKRPTLIAGSGEATLGKPVTERSLAEESVARSAGNRLPLALFFLRLFLSGVIILLCLMFYANALGLGWLGLVGVRLLCGTHRITSRGCVVVVFTAARGKKKIVFAFL